MSFQFFLQDKSLWDQQGLDVYEDINVDAGYAYMSDKVKSYFQTPKHVPDQRSNRLSVSGSVSTYPMRLTYDEDRALPDDPNNLTDPEREQLFNIIEALTYYSFMDNTAMENELIGDNSAYGIYVPGSFTRSSTVATVDFHISEGDVPDALDIHKKISFDIAGAGLSTSVTVWISKADFLADYPYSTIVEIVYPGDPERLVDIDYSGLIGAMSEATAFAFNQLNTPVAGLDNSGVVIFTSEYYPTGTTNHGTVSFAVIYKGPEPSTQELREAIRTELLGLGITSQEVWEEVLPDLFVNGKFYIIPIWDHVKALPTVTLPQGIISTDKLLNVAKAMFPNIELSDPGWLSDHLETLVSAGSEYQMISLPDYGNAVELLSLLAEHPTYQPIDATKPFFQYQESQTQDFNVSLSNAMAILTGGTNLGNFTSDEIDGRLYITFIAGGVEYHVLKQPSFPASY